MRSKFFLLISVMSLAVIVSGCGNFRAYMTDKERVDQALPGTPGFAGSAEEPVKKTRKVFVVEFTEKQKAPEETSVTTTKTAVSEEPGVSRVVTESEDTVVVNERDFSFPKMTAETLAPREAGAVPVEYTVQKDDTLQKISKKFYGSYSKWTKIYEMNKDRIKDPNFLKPGTVLVLPQIGEE